MSSILRLLLLAFTLVLGLAFHSRNHQPVRLDFYTTVVELPLSWIVVGALTLGALLGILVLVPRLLTLRRGLARETKRANALASLPPPVPSDGR